MSAGNELDAKDPGPVVRPYALTEGRTEPADGEILAPTAVVVASGAAAGRVDLMALRPEHRRILGLCRKPATLGAIASGMAMPLGVVRVLLADLIVSGRITVLPHQPTGEQPRAELLKEVLQGLRAL